jgi:predicted metal-dependent hydrolase
LSPEVRDYIIVHEICHIKEFNHGKDFWALVGEMMPEYKALRKQLRAVS